MKTFALLLFMIPSIVFGQVGFFDCNEPVQDSIFIFEYYNSPAFGKTIAVVGDELAVGMKWDKNFVYKFVNGSYTLMQVLQLPQMWTDGDWFFEGDLKRSGNTIVAPISRYLDEDKYRGLAVFEKVGNTWEFIQVLQPSDPVSILGTTAYAASDAFAIFNDWIVVGDPDEGFNNSSGVYYGIVYIYKKIGDDWVEVETLAQTNPTGRLGKYIAGYGDDFVVSLSGSGNNPDWIFRVSYINDTWEVSTVIEPESVVGTIALICDLEMNQDQIAILGQNGIAIIPNTATTNIGLASVISNTSGRKIHFNPENGNQLLIGNPSFDTEEISNIGKAMLAELSGGSWSITREFLQENPEIGNAHGNSLAFLGDNILVSSPYKSISISENQGAVYNYSCNGFPISVETTTENQNSEIRVFPNPSNGLVQIESDQEIIGIQVLDLTGKIVFTSTEKKVMQTIDLSELPKGMYLLRFETQDGVMQTKKIILE